MPAAATAHLAPFLYGVAAAVPFAYDNGLPDFPLLDDFDMRAKQRAEELLRPGAVYHDAFPSRRYSPDVPIGRPSSSRQPPLSSLMRTTPASDSTGASVTSGPPRAWPCPSNWTASTQHTLLAPRHGTDSVEASSNSPDGGVLTPASSYHGFPSPYDEESMEDVEEDALSATYPSPPGRAGSEQASALRHWSTDTVAAPLHPLSNHPARPGAMLGFAQLPSHLPTTLSTPRTSLHTHPSNASLASPSDTWMQMDTEDDPPLYQPFGAQLAYSEQVAYAPVSVATYATGPSLHFSPNYTLGPAAYQTTLQSQQSPLLWSENLSTLSQPPVAWQYQVQPPQSNSPPQLRGRLVELAAPDYRAEQSSFVQQDQIPDAHAPQVSLTESHAAARSAQESSVTTPAASQSSRNAGSERASQTAKSIQTRGHIKAPRYTPASSSSPPAGALLRKVARPLHPKVKAEVSSTSSNSPRGVPKPSRKGGRRNPLSERDKLQTAEMRNSGACWKCVIQRDKCNDNTPCERCESRSARAHAHYFPCNRSKLPDFVKEFLPPTMTLMHERQTIEDTIQRQVQKWSWENPVDIYLTTGYGQPLRWKVYEFLPKTAEFLRQLQYFQNPETGLSEGYFKYSPPYALPKLDDADNRYVESYLASLMTADCLQDLGSACFEEESEEDPNSFQCKMLDLMCTLYSETQDEKLRDLLHWIVRMMVITYIMGRTLTIAHDTLPDVLSNIRLSQPEASARHTSPRLVNRQLKFFFSVLRMDVFNEILKWQQHTFHTSGKKEDTWLSSFCAMLGLAMVLEEIQRTLQIQADAKIQKEEMARDDALDEARNACDRINERFDLLTRLFQWKYPQKKFGNGSFGPGTPAVGGEAEHHFLSQLRPLVEESENHLKRREDVKCSYENQCRYTSRLVAPFLLRFLTFPF